MKKTLLLILVLIISCFAKAQDYNKTDSLKQILRTLPELNGTDNDTLRMRICIDIGTILEKTNPDSALWWYTSVSDTSNNVPIINMYKGRAALNAIALKNAGKVISDNGNYSLSIIYYNFSLNIYRELGDAKGEARCLMNIGNVLFFKGNINKAEEYYNMALKTFESAGDKRGVSYCMGSIGNVYTAMKNYPRAKYYFEQTLKLSEEANDKKSVSNSLNNLGLLSMYTGNFVEATEYYEQSLKIKEGLGDLTGISNCLGNIGNAARDQGFYSKSLEYLSRTLEMKQELGDKKGLANCYMGKGNTLKEMGDFPAAIENIEEAIKLFTELNDSNYISTCLLTLGIISYDQGNFDNAIEYYEKSKKISEDIYGEKGISNALTNIGLVFWSKGNYDKALENFNHSLQIDEGNGDKQGISICYTNIGLVMSDLKKFNETIDYYNKAIKIAEELGDKKAIAYINNNTGILYYEYSKYAESIPYFELSVKLFEEMGDKSNLAKEYSNLGKAYMRKGNPANAYSLFLKSVNLTNWLLEKNFSILTESEKEMYLDQTKDVFNALLVLNYKYPEISDSLPGLCYNNELVLKGLLLKSTKGIMDAILNKKDNELASAYFLHKQYRNQIASAFSEKEESRDSLIADLENKASDQERKLVRLSSEYAGTQELFNCNWKEVYKSLKQGEAAIEFVTFFKDDKKDSSVFAALVISPQSKSPVFVRLFEGDQLKKITGSKTETGFDYISSLYSNKNRILYDLLWKPLEPFLKGVNTVYYAKAGILNNISFAALASESGAFLCDYIDLRQVSTTGILTSQNTGMNNNELSATIFGGIDYNPDTVKQELWPYLPGTLNEKEKIEKQFNKNNVACRSFSGKNAKEEKFKALFDSTEAPSILHVSTHGFFYPDPEQTRKEAEAKAEAEDGKLVFRGSNGFGNWMFLNNKNPMMRTGLVFAGANRVWSEDWGRTDNEGVLTAYEVSNMNMRNTSLVVLSACETGLGDIKGSEGVYGLQRAFKMAGVKYIIMSLWQVPDKETVEFMEMFYKKLLKQKDVRLAFNETQKEMRKKYDPYYWAAFVLVE